MKSIALGVLLLTAAISTGLAEARKWTDATGKFSVEAELIGVKDGRVQLRKADGTTITVPLRKLSVGDQEHIKRQAGARTYPSFPDAATKPPAWEDAEPPLDVAELFKVPDEGQNAAPLYLDAFFEFSPEMSICFGPAGEPARGEAKRREEAARRRCREQRRFDDTWEKDRESVDGAAVDAWLKQYDAGFKKLAAAQRQPRCMFETGLSCASLTPHVQAARDVARVVEWRIRRDVQRGEFERSIKDVETVLRMSRDLRPRGDAVPQLASIAVEGMCCHRMVPVILAAPTVQTRHCDRLLTLLTEHEAKAIDPFLEGLRVGCVIDRQTLHDLQHRTGTFGPRYMKEELEVRGNVQSWVSCIKLLEIMSEISPTAMDRMKAVIDKKGKLEHPVLRNAWVGGKVLSDDDYFDEVNALNRVYASILRLAERPKRPLPGEFKTSLARLRKPLEKTTLAMLLTSSANENVLNAALRGQATVRGAQCLVAVRRWRLEHKELPKDLDTIVKAAGLRSAPIDPYSGQPLRMTVIEGKPVVYSVGPDGKDDKGLVESKGGSRPGDLVFRLGASAE